MSLRWKSCRRAVLLPAALALAGPTEGQTVEVNPQAILVTGPVALDITNALRGALRKLEDPACQQLLDAFKDREGRPLREHLGAATPAEHLARLLIHDGEIPKGSHRCFVRNAAAFTSDGAAVFVCGTSFQLRTRAFRENALIHEMLHTLGLRENPPTSAEISGRVAASCGS